MTLDEFYVRLKEKQKRIKATWKTEGAFRTTALYSMHCPISFVANGDYNIGDWVLAAREIGLSKEDANTIYYAADNYKTHKGFNPEVRAKLEKILYETT
jgi:hypothetical protein